MITKRSFLLGTLATSLLAATSLQAAPKEFRIGYQKSSGILVVARQQEALEKRLKTLGVTNVRWVEFQFGPPLLEALSSGAVDIGAVGDAPPILAQSAGANLVYVASAPATQNAILVPKDSPIKTVADLKGKKIAFGKGSSSHNLVVQALKQGGVKYSEIEPAFLAPADAAAAFATNRVDAWAIWDPYYAIAQKRHDARALVTTQNGLGSHSFYLANKSFADANPEVLSAALDELRKVTAWATKNRDKLASVTAEVTGIPFDVQKTAIDRYPLEFNALTEPVLAQQQAIADAFFEIGLIPKKITVRDIVWSAPKS